jgi:hypothetical protein
MSVSCRATGTVPKITYSRGRRLRFAFWYPYYFLLPCAFLPSLHLPIALGGLCPSAMVINLLVPLRLELLLLGDGLADDGLPTALDLRSTPGFSALQPGGAQEWRLDDSSGGLGTGGELSRKYAGQRRWIVRSFNCSKFLRWKFPRLAAFGDVEKWERE